MDAESKSLLITPAEAARLLGLDQVSTAPERVVRNMARHGELRAVRVRRFIMIDRKSVEQYVAQGV